MNIVIFGGNGQTGRLLTQSALASGHRAIAVTRQPESFPLSATRLTVAAADARDAAAVAEVVSSADVVLSTLGVSFTRAPVDTYSVGTGAIVAAMQASGVRRLVVVSSSGAFPTRRSQTPLARRIFEPIVTRTIGKTVYDDIRRMETIVRESALDGTIVRPSGLFDLPQVTDYLAGLSGSGRRLHCPHRLGRLHAGAHRRLGHHRQDRCGVDHRAHAHGVADGPPGGRVKALEALDADRALSLAAKPIGRRKDSQS